MPEDRQKESTLGKLKDQILIVLLSTLIAGAGAYFALSRKQARVETEIEHVKNSLNDLNNKISYLQDLIYEHKGEIAFIKGGISSHSLAIKRIASVFDEMAKNQRNESVKSMLLKAAEDLDMLLNTKKGKK